MELILLKLLFVFGLLTASIYGVLVMGNLNGGMKVDVYRAMGVGVLFGAIRTVLELAQMAHIFGIIATLDSIYYSALVVVAHVLAIIFLLAAFYAIDGESQRSRKMRKQAELHAWQKDQILWLIDNMGCDGDDVSKSALFELFKYKIKAVYTADFKK